MNPWANLLLALCVVPEVWLLWKVANWFVDLHDKRYVKDVQKIMGGPLPHQRRRVRR